MVRVSAPGATRARDAGVTRALVYHYFPGKDALLAAVLQQEAEGLLAATEPDPAMTPTANLRRSLVAYLDHFAASSGQLRDLYAPVATSAPIVHELAGLNHAAQVERIVNALDLADSAILRLAVVGWLGFVEEVAAAAESADGVTRAEVVTLCINALMSVTGSDIPDDTSTDQSVVQHD